MYSHVSRGSSTVSAAAPGAGVGRREVHCRLPHGAQRRRDLLELVQVGEEFLELVGEVGVPREQHQTVGRIPRLGSLQVGGQDLIEGVIRLNRVAGLGDHGYSRRVVHQQVA
jgi:hypothetical protein